MLTLSFCTFLVFGCQSQDKEMTLLDNISSVSISESDGYGGMNEKYFMVVVHDAFLSEFEKVLTTAKGNELKVSVYKEIPDYDLLVRYANGETHGLHLKLGNIGEKSRVMYVGNENNGFDISPEDTKILRGILENN